MNRQELLAENIARTAEILDDQAARKFAKLQREHLGYFDVGYTDDPSAPQLVYKSRDGSINPIAPLTQNYTMPKIDDGEHSVVHALADEVGVITGSLERRIELLEKRIAELESK